MAQLTALEVVNKVLENNGLSTVASLAGLSGINKVTLNAVDLILTSTATSDYWRPLETTDTITVVTDTQTYAQPSDYVKANKNSFTYNSNGKLKYVDSQEIDELTNNPSKSATPSHIYEIGSSWYLYPVPTSSQNNDTFFYRYWKTGARIDTASPSANTWFPEPYDSTVLVNLATAKVLMYRQMPEAQFYLEIVHGVPGRTEGTLAMMQKNLRSPTLYRVPVRVNF